MESSTPPYKRLTIEAAEPEAPPWWSSLDRCWQQLGSLHGFGQSTRSAHGAGAGFDSPSSGGSSNLASPSSLSKRPSLSRRTTSTKLTAVTSSDGSLPDIIPEEDWERYAKKNAKTLLLFPSGPLKFRWDLFILVLILYSCISVPFRLGMNCDPKGGWWVFEVFVSFAFIVGIFANFHTAAVHGDQLILNRSEIASRYRQGWFIVDLVSVFPFWCLTLEWHDMFGNLPPANITGEDSITFERTAVIFRVVRLLRLLKLARVLKASRILQRHLLDVITNYLELTYSVLELLKLVVILIVWSHWQA